MFAGWGSWVARFRWPVLSVALVAVISAGVWGLGLFSQLTEGGYTDPGSESTHASDAITEAFGAQGGDLVVIYTPTKGKIDDAALGKAVTASLAKLPKSAVTASSSYWSAKSAAYAAKDKSSAVALITLAGDDDAAKLDAYREIDDKFAVDGATVRLSGATALADASSTRSTQDLGKAEAISVPITLILLVFIFGSLVAASLPVLVGGAAVLGSLGILHAVAGFHDVNSFAVNVASLLGLGMAIDYGLFMVGRFREEQAEGRTPSEAVARTVGTAGRTVVFSATMLMIALSGLLLFPQGFLKSLAYGGLASVFLAAFLSLTLLPALLAVLGPRVDKLPVRLPFRSRSGSGNGWTRLAGFVLKHPMLVAVPILVVLFLLASPVRHVKFGENDERQLPAGDPSRVAIETLKSDYPQFTGDSVQIVLRGTTDTANFAVQLRQVPGIAQLGVPRKTAEVSVFTATLKTSDAFSDEARQVVDDIRALPVPSGATLLVGGTTARNVDSLDATADRLPLMIGLLVGATLLLMFLAFGSILLPIKAVVMSALSLSATFGALVWIFQDGHGAGWLHVSPAPLEVGIVVLMAAVVFGLSTDYEVFLLSRMVEARTQGASTDEAVTKGLSSTGRVISAAALLLIVVTGAFAMSAITTMRFVGVGMIIALLLDATVVRMLLVPAVLRLLGDAAWWAPGPLRRLQQRAGLAEYESDPSPAPSAGRHALPDDTQVLSYSGPAYALPFARTDLRSMEEISGLRSLEEVSGEIMALPAPESPMALPSGSNDATQVFSRFEETQVLSLPAAPDATVVADEDPVDAEIVEPDQQLFSAPDAPALREFDPEQTATRLAELSGFLPAVPTYDTPTPPKAPEESYFFGAAGTTPLALPSSPWDTDRPAVSIPVIPGMSLPITPGSDSAEIPPAPEEPLSPADTQVIPRVTDSDSPASVDRGSLLPDSDPNAGDLAQDDSARPETDGSQPTDRPEPELAAPEAAAAEPEAVTATEPDALTATEPEAVTATEPDAFTAAEPDALTAAEPEAVTEPDASTATEPEAVTAPEPDAFTAAEAEPEAASFASEVPAAFAAPSTYATPEPTSPSPQPVEFTAPEPISEAEDQPATVEAPSPEPVAFAEPTAPDADVFAVPESSAFAESAPIAFAAPEPVAAEAPEPTTFTAPEPTTEAEEPPTFAAPEPAAPETPEPPTFAAPDAPEPHLLGVPERVSASASVPVSAPAADNDPEAEEESSSEAAESYAPVATYQGGGELGEEFYARAAATLFGPDPAESDYAYAPSAQGEAGPTVDLAPRMGRPSTLADQTPARRPGNRPADLGSYTKDGLTSSRRPATLGDQPFPRRPMSSFSEPQPMTEPEPQQPPAAEPAPRRPADLADHLRESRPADLSDYTAGRIPRSRRPADNDPSGLLPPAANEEAEAVAVSTTHTPGGDPAASTTSTESAAASAAGQVTGGAPRRPATLADHLSSRRKTDDAGSDRDVTD